MKKLSEEDSSSRKDLIWIAYSNDKYELPVYCANTLKELAAILNVSYGAVRSGVTRRGKYKKMKISKVYVS
ncbi:hypothetical protein [uncultured Clostridium sp.]|uniref:hypothetical protein n=1 Tax=uncultured Clostridium sp. TaxID=59620 RepID=UPI002635CD12|nr:hypothetical protein [uncultured Clostridium sp.]MCI9110286.1 hypothetical protein [Bacilli bacterium]